MIEGPVYTVTALKFSGNTIYSPDDLTKAIKFVLGEPAKMGAFRDRLIGLHTLYGRHGYLAAKFDITPVLESNATAELNINVREGKQYRVGTIQFSGINPLSVGQILSTWNLKPGTVYDDNYFRKFMAIDFVKWAPRGSRWEWTTHEALHDDTSTVDVMVDVNFKPGSAHP